MNTTEASFAGERGRELFLRRGEVPDAIASVVIIHGFGEHSGRYEETMQRFAAQGYATYAMDLRGFGRSAKIIAHMEALDLVAEDVHLLTELAQSEHKSVPRVLLGHSMGGLLALNQVLVHPRDFQFLITSGPALLPPSNANGFMIAVSRVLSKVFPLLPVSPLEKDADTRNSEMKARDAEDELIYHGGFRAKTGYELLQMQMALEKRLPEITIPLLALHGEGDLIIDPRATNMLMDSVGSRDKEKVTFPVLYHEVLNEPERDQVFEVIFRWLGERVGASGR